MGKLVYLQSFISLQTNKNIQGLLWKIIRNEQNGIPGKIIRMSERDWSVCLGNLVSERDVLSLLRFWKMAHTFTGLKLQGALGRFGKTAVTDIIGYVELPDGKVSHNKFNWFYVPSHVSMKSSLSKLESYYLLLSDRN